MIRTLLLLFIVSNCAVGGFRQRTAGGRDAALAGTDIACPAQVWSIAYNPAALYGLNALEAGFSISPEPFGIHELSSMSVCLGIKAPVGVLAAAANRFGFDLYHETLFALAIANRIAGLNVGACLNYYSFSIERYGHSGTWGLDCGILLPVGSHLCLALDGENVNMPTMGSTHEPLQQTFSFGLYYSPVDSVGLEVDYEKDIGFDPTIKGGIEYWLTSGVSLRAGFSQLPSIISCGLGIRLKFIQLEYAYSVHAELGETHQLSFTLFEGN